MFNHHSPPFTHHLPTIYPPFQGGNRAAKMLVALQPQELGDLHRGLTAAPVVVMTSNPQKRYAEKGSSTWKKLLQILVYSGLFKILFCVFLGLLAAFRHVQHLVGTWMLQHNDGRLVRNYWYLGPKRNYELLNGSIMMVWSPSKCWPKVSHFWSSIDHYLLATPLQRFCSSSLQLIATSQWWIPAPLSSGSPWSQSLPLSPPPRRPEAREHQGVPNIERMDMGFSIDGDTPIVGWFLWGKIIHFWMDENWG